MFTLNDPDPLLLGDEPIWRDDVLVGRITSGAYGHTLGRSIGMGYVRHPAGVDAALVRSGRWELEIASERFAARAQLEPPYDPKSLRVRG
jgi:glycine cleavage system aminomethyltransferase T